MNMELGRLEPARQRTNETIWRLFGGSEKAAKMTLEEYENGWFSPPEDWGELSADGALYYVGKLSEMGFRVRMERSNEGAVPSGCNRLPGELARTGNRKWSVTIEYGGGANDGDPRHAPNGPFLGTGDKLQVALAAAMVDIDTRWATGRSIQAALRAQGSGQPELAQKEVVL